MQTGSILTVPFKFPESPSVDNPVVAIESNIYGFFNFVLRDGTKSAQSFNNTPVDIKTILDRPVRRIDLYSEPVEGIGNRANCIMLYDKHAQRLVDAGYDEEDDKLMHYAVEEDEVIVGVESFVMKDRPAAHIDLQFLIAKKM